MSETLRYGAKAVRADYLRAGAGLVLSLGPALALPLGSAAQYVLLPVAAMFALFAVRTRQRQIARVELDGAGISIFSPRRVSLRWDDVRSVKLSYFSTRADRTGGWMQLTLKGGDAERAGQAATIRLDSSLEAFEHVVHRAAAAALANGANLPDATRSNLAALGIPLDALAPETGTGYA